MASWTLRPRGKTDDIGGAFHPQSHRFGTRKRNVKHYAGIAKINVIDFCRIRVGVGCFSGPNPR